MVPSMGCKSAAESDTSSHGTAEQSRAGAGGSGRAHLAALPPCIWTRCRTVEQLIDINDHIEDAEVRPDPCVMCSRHSAGIALWRHHDQVQ